MKARHIPYLAAAVLLVAAALLLIHRFGWFDTSTAPVVLPDTSPYAASAPPEGRGGLIPAKVTPETVQAVVATLSRPDGYSRELQVVSSWLGGEAAWQVQVWHKGSSTRIRITPETEGEPEKDVLIQDREILIRYGDDRRVFRSTAGSPALTDALQLIPSYEDVLALEPGQIKEAGYVEQDGVWRILVAARATSCATTSPSKRGFWKPPTAWMGTSSFTACAPSRRIWPPRKTRFSFRIGLSY